MANYQIPEQPSFDVTAVRKLETTDPAHADFFNVLFQRAYENEAYLNKQMDDCNITQPGKADIINSMSMLGGPSLSGEKVQDPDAQYDVIEKSGDETGQIFTADMPLQKGLYSVAIRLKVSDVSSAENILKLDITDGDKVMSKYIKPQMLKTANKYTTIGCAAECTSGTLGITLSIDKVWAGQTVRVDYVTIAPAMVSISSL